MTGSRGVRAMIDGADDLMMETEATTTTDVSYSSGRIEWMTLILTACRLL